MPASWVIPLLTEAILNITLLPGIQISRSEESMQKTSSSSTGRSGCSTNSSTSGYCPRNCTSRCANSCAPYGLAGDLFTPYRPWSGLLSLPDAFVNITLNSIRGHLLEMFIRRQNWAFSRTSKAGKNNRKTYG